MCKTSVKLLGHYYCPRSTIKWRGTGVQPWHHKFQPGTVLVLYGTAKADTRTQMAPDCFQSWCTLNKCDWWRNYGDVLENPSLQQLFSFTSSKNHRHYRIDWKHRIKEYPSRKEDHKREHYSEVYQHYLRGGGISQCVCQTKGMVI